MAYGFCMPKVVQTDTEKVKIKSFEIPNFEANQTVFHISGKLLKLFMF